MKRLVTLVLAVLALTGTGAARAEVATPNAYRAAATQVVQAFFDAMHAGDTATIARLVLPGTQLNLTVAGAPGAALTRKDVEAFIGQVKAAPAPYLERMWSPTVLVDGAMAVVWTRYDFHRGASFSHNGRDCFVLLKGADGWRIVSLDFTVEPGGVNENPAGSPR